MGHAVRLRWTSFSMDSRHCRESTAPPPDLRKTRENWPGTPLARGVLNFAEEGAAYDRPEESLGTH
jgi:hypothetical protein